MSSNFCNVDMDIPNTLVSGPGQQVSGAWNLLSNNYHYNWRSMQGQIPQNPQHVYGNPQVVNNWSPQAQRWQNGQEFPYAPMHVAPIPPNGLVRPASNCHVPAYITSANKPQVAKKPKRVRTAFTTDQLLALEAAFSKSTYVSKAERVSLSQMLGLKDRAIKVWFQNRRMKQKRDKEFERASDEDYLGAPSYECSSTTDTMYACGYNESQENQTACSQNNINHPPGPIFQEIPPQNQCTTTSQELNAGVSLPMKTERHQDNITTYGNMHAPSQSKPFYIDTASGIQGVTMNHIRGSNPYITKDASISGDSVKSDKLQDLVSQCIDNDFENGHSSEISPDQPMYQPSTVADANSYLKSNFKSTDENINSSISENTNEYLPNSALNEEVTIKYEDISTDSEHDSSYGLS